MDFSFREEQILESLLENPKGLTVEQLMRRLNVSRRTIYRELKTLEQTLASTPLWLEAKRGQGYQLKSDKAEAYSWLKSQLKQTQTDTIDAEERQNLLTITLLLQQMPVTAESLAEAMGVSVGTIQNDLQGIAQSLLPYKLKLERQAGIGTLVTGSEYHRRQIVSLIINSRLSEVEFFRYVNHLTAENLPVASHKFLKYIQPRHLLAVRKVLQDEADQLLKAVTDNQLQQVMIGLALSLDRMTQGYSLKEQIEVQGIQNQDLQLAHQITGYLSDYLGYAFNINERHYSARLLAGVNYNEHVSIFGENFDTDLSFRVKELIRLTTERTGNDFRRDQKLYQDLLAHIQAALKRPSSLTVQVINDALDDIQQRYAELYRIVIQAFQEVFPKEHLSKDEMTYIVIHFATSLERRPMSLREISVLVICSSGIGSARILESRLHKRIPEINRIDIARFSQIHNMNYDGYDLILSTIHLDHFTQAYEIISPLLLDDEVERIRSIIQQWSQKEKSDALDVFEKRAKPHAFDRLYQTMTQANVLLQRFTVTHFESKHDLESTLHGIIAKVPEEIILEPTAVAEQVVQRYHIAPLGIPKTNLALFHSANTWVKVPYFAVIDLSQNFEIMGMDHQMIEMDRVLLLLGPEEMSESEQELLGIISRSVIESDLNTEIFKHGDQEQIYQLLSALFVEAIRHIE